MTTKKRYAVVGAGGRGEMYVEFAATGCPEKFELVALCDSNPGRVRLAAESVRAKGVTVPTYSDKQFTRMIRETKPDCVIVTTRDCFHDKYICRAMELGCDVITEKPMTIDQRRCRRILQTQKTTGRKCGVTFNYRYSPPRTQIKDLLMSGVIGDVISVDFHWLLDTHHGADYFRRWHRNLANSGGLLVHKATHHFDLINWWLSTVPETVYATGQRRFYTPQQADRYGLNRRAEGGHGGGDTPLLLDVFGVNDKPDKYLRVADQRAGAWSILTGVAANESIRTGRPIRIRNLVPELEYPDYPPMPSAQDPIPMEKPTVRQANPEWALNCKREQDAAAGVCAPPSASASPALA